MKISVIIPCHNAAPWITGALRSVALQTYPAHEILLIDDGSTDGSLALAEKSAVAARILRVAYRNAAAARNAGIEIATGDWIALLDADDVWYPYHLARAVELLSGSSDVAFMSNHDWIGLGGEMLPIPDEFRCKLAFPRAGLDVGDYYRLHSSGFHFGHSTVLYRLDRIREVGLFDPAQKRRHDIDLWLRMIADRTWTYDTVKSVGYRENTPGSISKDEIECDYYYLRALVKNLDKVTSPLHKEYLAGQARRAMGIAFVEAELNPEHYASIRELAWPHLSPAYRGFYTAAGIFPALARKAMKVKRRMQNIARTTPAAAAAANPS